MTKGFLIFHIQEQQNRCGVSARYSKMNKISIKKDNKIIKFKGLGKHIIQKVHV